MKRFLLFFCLSLIYLWGGVISAYADDVYFEPESGASYLIYSKGDHRYALWNEKSTLVGNSSVNVLTAVSEISEGSYFTIEKTTVDSKRYYYIRSKKDASQYVYAISTGNADSNVGVKSTTEPDASCLWNIVYNKNSRGFNIKPKDGSNGWNCRSNNSSYQQVGQWDHNDNNNNTWFFISEPCTLNGYYTLKNGGSSRPTNYYNDFVTNSDNVSRASNTLPENVTNNYIWHVTNSNNVITVTNGQGTSLKTDNDYGVLPQLDVIEYTTNKGFVFGPVLNAGTNGQLTTWESDWGTNTSKGDNCWKFTPVSTDGKTMYTVSIDHADGYVTYTSTSESAKNGGFIFLSSTPSAEDFSAGQVNGYVSSVTVEGTVIRVHYARTVESVKSYAAELKTIVDGSGILDKEGVVGYPLASAKEAYQTALQNVENAETGKTEEECNALFNALDNAYNSLLTSAKMPEDGKAYKIVYQYINGKNQQLYWNGTRTATKEEGNITDPYSAIFVCHKTEDGKYVFATNQGTYLSWYDSGNASSANSTSGVTDGYSSCNLWTVEIADNNANGGTIDASISRVNLLGCFQMKAPNKDNNNNQFYLQTRYEGENADGAFISQWANTKYYDGNNGKPRSHAFKFVEVEYPNTVNFSSTNGAITGVPYIATFSAPFATVIPNGVTAYYVTKNESKAELKEITSDAIPANVGVLLGSESANSVCMIPATSEEASVDASNALGNTAGQSKDLTVGECYILGAKNNKVAFYLTAAGTLPMNKAYLKKDANDNTPSSFQMVFNGETTGIEGILVDEDADAPVYDLTGRRVLKAAKGNVYIKNGKKFIVK